MKQTDLEKLLADMSLKEKVDQMLQLSGAFYLGDENSVLTGPANDMGIGKEDLEMAGSILGAAGAGQLQRVFHRKTESAGHERAVPLQISRYSERTAVSVWLRTFLYHV